MIVFTKQKNGIREWRQKSIYCNQCERMWNLFPTQWVILLYGNHYEQAQ